MNCNAHPSHSRSLRLFLLTFFVALSVTACVEEEENTEPIEAVDAALASEEEGDMEPISETPPEPNAEPMQGPRGDRMQGEHPRGERPEASPCRESCVERSHHTFRACREEGGEEERCGHRARGYVHECVADFCEERPARGEGEGEREERGICEDSCIEQAREGATACAESSEAEQVGCHREARSRAARCISERCNREDRPERTEPAPDPCMDSCHSRSHQAMELCLQEGNEAEQCARRAHHRTRQCMKNPCDAPERPEGERPEGERSRRERPARAGEDRPARGERPQRPRRGRRNGGERPAEPPQGE